MGFLCGAVSVRSMHYIEVSGVGLPSGVLVWGCQCTHHALYRGEWSGAAEWGSCVGFLCGAVSVRSMHYIEVSGVGFLCGAVSVRSMHYIEVSGVGLPSGVLVWGSCVGLSVYVACTI